MGRCIATRKLHAFEHAAISSGVAYTVFDTPWGVRLAILLCRDNNPVESVRAVALLGATVLLAPHQTGGTSSRSPHGMKPIPVETWRGCALSLSPVPRVPPPFCLICLPAHITSTAPNNFC